MFWQIQRDFSSLFTRRNDKDNHFHPIDGLRSISNLLIISLHLVAIFTTFISPYPHSQWVKYLESKAFALSNYMLFSLETFFMLSGFLLTYKLITQWNRYFPSMELFFQREYPISILKRALRFWPGILLASLILFVFGEPFYPNSSYIFEFFRNLNIWMFFQNYIDFEYWYFSLTPLWSISIDMQVHILLPLFIYLFYSIRKYISIFKSLVFLLIISIIRGIIVFNPETMPIGSVAYHYPSLPLLSPLHLNHWLQNNYNLTFQLQYKETNAMKLFMQQMYLPLDARIGSFIIGAMLAIKIIQNSLNSNNTKPKRFKKYFFFGLVFLHLLSLLQSSDLPPSPPDFILRFLVGTGRQLFTLGQAFILFSALCPPTHPYHSRWIKTFLSSSIWIPISKLSYLVYLIHLRISLELIFGGPLRFLKTYSVTQATLISLPIVLILSQIISSIWYVLAEKPIERAIKYYSKRYQLSKIDMK
ncbi:unnamed protein product [Adineta steineri]|uniref:Acyltransferase 3 domain-containing protein n=1 Tax=Adineta steineri TaxID=433720 RepID=A0A818VR87_9BILA|nr:unnamed protein product [Adineta steineri]CAF3714902.1 unnamed protein product [Adineta steineri]